MSIGLTNQNSATQPAAGRLTLAATAICNASRADLDDLDSKIEDAENQVAMLRTLRKLVVQRLGGDKTKKASSNDGRDKPPRGALAKSIVDMLAEKGPMSMTDLATAIGQYRSVVAMAISRIATVQKDGDTVSLIVS